MIQASRTTFSEILDLADDELSRLQFKITYVGEQRKLLPSLIVGGRAVLDEVPEILSICAPNLDFGNDIIARSILSASDEELRAVINVLNQFPNVRFAGGDTEFGGVTRDPLLVLSLLYRDVARNLVLVVPLDPTDSELVLDALGTALRHNKECRAHLHILWRALGFHIGVLDPDTDGDGASDGRSRSYGTDPSTPSSAGDGVLDGERIIAGLDPLNVLQPLPQLQLVSVDSGPFRGSRVLDVTTAPEKTWGTVTLEFSYAADQFVAEAERLVFMQTFKRSGLKANGIRVPFSPSLYLVYAGSPELDQLTIDGQTVDHKVGELDPYYNGDDPHDLFSVVPEKQCSGSYTSGRAQEARMLYRARTFENHWRLLNPEGIADVQFDYETAIFCDRGPAMGQFLGVINWTWGKRRGENLRATIQNASSVQGPPDATVTIIGLENTSQARVYSVDAVGQPSVDYLKVLALWNKHHKFALPGPILAAGDGVSLTIPQPVTMSVSVAVSKVTAPTTPTSMKSRGLQASYFARTISAHSESGVPLRGMGFPFALPITVTFTYTDEDVDGLDASRLGVGRVDLRSNEIHPEGITVLSKNPDDRSVTFTTDRLGTFAIVGAQTTDNPG
jgi:hypothetical protein